MRAEMTVDGEMATITDTTQVFTIPFLYFVFLCALCVLRALR